MITLPWPYAVHTARARVKDVRCAAVDHGGGVSMTQSDSYAMKTMKNAATVSSTIARPRIPPFIFLAVTALWQRRVIPL